MKYALLVVFLQLSFFINSHAQSSYAANEDTTIFVSVDKTKLKLTFTKGFLFEIQKISNDTLFISAQDISSFKSLFVSENQELWTIYQRYKNQLAIGFDDKLFIINYWKAHYSPWITLRQREPDFNTQEYSQFDWAYFPEYNKKELLEAIKLNAEDYTEHWTDFFLQAFEKELPSEDGELYLTPFITESHFKLSNVNGESIIIILEHQTGC
jgi:hypothetical protein